MLSGGGIQVGTERAEEWLAQGKEPALTKRERGLSLD